jgi:hypothetical protein
MRGGSNVRVGLRSDTLLSAVRTHIEEIARATSQFY